MARRKPHRKRALRIDRMRKEQVTYARNECSKIAYQSREMARAGARRHSQGEQLRPYRCETCALWHVGHLPRAVRRGDVTADEYYGRSA